MPEAMERWSLDDAADDASGSSVVRARELPDSPAAGGEEQPSRLVPVGDL